MMMKRITSHHISSLKTNLIRLSCYTLYLNRIGEREKVERGLKAEIKMQNSGHRAIMVLKVMIKGDCNDNGGPLIMKLFRRVHHSPAPTHLDL